MENKWILRVVDALIEGLRDFSKNNARALSTKVVDKTVDCHWAAPIPSLWWIPVSGPMKTSAAVSIEET
jgi:hypothetical protein